MTAAPGPYTVDKQDGEDEASAVYLLGNEQGGPFCSVEIEGALAERDATAHLLATSWQLREALLAIVEAAPVPKYGYATLAEEAEKWTQAVDLARAALAATNWGGSVVTPPHRTDDLAYLRFLIVELRQQTTEAFAIIEQRLAELEAARQTEEKEARQ